MRIHRIQNIELKIFEQLEIGGGSLAKDATVLTDQLEINVHTLDIVQMLALPVGDPVDLTVFS